MGGLQKNCIDFANNSFQDGVGKTQSPRNGRFDLTRAIEMTRWLGEINGSIG